MVAVSRGKGEVYISWPVKNVVCDLRIPFIKLPKKLCATSIYISNHNILV